MANAQIGDIAPDFALVDHRGQVHTMSQYRGNTVLLTAHLYSFGGH